MARGDPSGDIAITARTSAPTCRSEPGCSLRPSPVPALFALLSRVLSFRLNGLGFITGIEDGGGPSVWPPFATMGLATIAVAAMAGDELESETDPDKRALLKVLADAPEPRAALAAIMNLRMLARS